MRPEAAEHIEKAHQCLARARTILAAEVPDVAGREAYLAAFHAAQALIAERTGRNARSHKGVHVQFARLTRDEAQIGQDLRQPHRLDAAGIQPGDLVQGLRSGARRGRG